MITNEYNDDDGCDDERKLHVFVFEFDITITVEVQVAENIYKNLNFKKALTYLFVTIL